MFNEAELSVVAEEVLSEQEAEREAQSNTAADKPRKKADRKPLPDSFPRLRIEHAVPDADNRCDCGCQRVEVGEVTSEQLDIIPAKVQVIVNVRKKYACQHCEAGVITAPLPSQPIPKSNTSPGLLAHVATAKYQDGLPLQSLPREAFWVSPGSDAEPRRCRHPAQHPGQLDDQIRRTDPAVNQPTGR